MSGSQQAPVAQAFTGRTYAVPPAAERAAEYARIETRVQGARARGMQIVVVQGLGFVGSVMAAVIAHARDEHDRPRYFVVGVDLPSPDAYWKVAMLNEGNPPVVSEDESVAVYLREAVVETRNLADTTDTRAYSLADVIVVDLNFDVDGLDAFAAGIRDVAEHMSAAALVLIETTVPPGTTSRVVMPILRDRFTERGFTSEPLLAHSYERVMPGRAYVASIERFWRTFAAESEQAASLTEAFLSSIIDTNEFPLRRLASTTASELAKVLENSYRAANIALIHEWTRAAEQIGVNLFEVVDSIAVRTGTHDNIRRPGFGVGGYCLTKDSYLAQWGLWELCDSDVELAVTLRAIAINEDMPRHSVEHLRGALGDLSGRTILVVGVSYLNDVADTRNSPTAVFCDLLESAGATAIVHDPYVTRWQERPDVPNLRFADGVARADAVVLAVRHRAFLELDAASLIGPQVSCVLDTQNLLSDTVAAELYERGVQPIGVGKGHWRSTFPLRASR